MKQPNCLDKNESRIRVDKNENNMELVPLNREKILTSLNIAKIPTKKVKVVLHMARRH